MEFLNPAALYGLLALPLLLIPYLIRRKPKRGHLFEPTPVRGARYALGGPSVGKASTAADFLSAAVVADFIDSRAGRARALLRASNVAIVLDNSASMQTLDNQQTRFALAQEKARELLADLGVTGKVDLYLTAPRLERVRGATFEPAEAAGVLAALAPYDLADTPIDYQSSLSQMAKERKYDRVFLITDHPAVGQTDTLRVITVGQPRDNFAVSSFNISHASLVGSRLEATAEVANYSSKDERIESALRGGDVSRAK